MSSSSAQQASRPRPHPRCSVARPWRAATRRPFSVIRLLAGVLTFAAVAVVGLRLYTVTRYSDRIVSPEAVPSGAVAVVFGAAVRLDGEPTSVLYDRVAEAAELYRAGRVTRVILSGDGRDPVLDEPAAMRRAALRLGVRDRDLVLDGAGLSTRETCRDAAELAAGAPLVLVTQRFHLTRALMLCEATGRRAVGVASDRRTYPWRWRVSWQARETAATAVAWFETMMGIGIRRLLE